MSFGEGSANWSWINSCPDTLTCRLQSQSVRSRRFRRMASKERWRWVTRAAEGYLEELLGAFGIGRYVGGYGKLEGNVGRSDGSS